jgi:hypothetical protein
VTTDSTTQLTTDEAIEQLSKIDDSPVALEMGADALAFVQSLHDMFRDNGMTAKEKPDLNELENLVDALLGELAAACIFLSEPSFSRVPDMLRVISEKLAKSDDVPVVVSKGYERLAKRIEVTRLNMQAFVKKVPETP